MRLPCIAILCLFCCIASAQKQNNNWCFGKAVGYTFDGTTQPLFYSASHAFEGGAATVSDQKTGALLFYTNGVDVWDAKHRKMFNGTGIGTDITLTSAQGSVIIPMPGDSSKYYIFTHEEQTSTKGAVYYSIVDMTLNGGRGDIIPGKKKIFLADGFAEGMTTTTSCGGHWLILLRRNSSVLVSYKIDVSGIKNTPVLSPTHYAAQDVSSIKVSPDTRHILLTLYAGADSVSTVAYGKFAKATGRVTNINTIDSFIGPNFYSSAFSQGGQMAYSCAYIEQKVYQYDLSLPDIKSIRASKRMIYSLSDQIGELQLGPDSNIYVAVLHQPFLDMITNADSLNALYNPQAVKLPYQGQLSTLSLPQAVLYPPYDDDSVIYLTTRTELNLCNGVELQLKARTDFFTYFWQDSSANEQIKVSKPGIYWVVSTKGCSVITDTFDIVELDISFSLGNDTAICTGEVVTLSAPSFSRPVSYLWQDNSTSKSITVNEAGSYHVTIKAGTCSVTDTVNVYVYERPYFNFGSDTVVCDNIFALNLDATSWDNCTYTWSVSGTGAIYSAATDGIYWATAENICGSLSDTIVIDFQNCDCRPLVPSFTPNNDGLNDNVKPLLNCDVEQYEFIILNRFGEVVFRSADKEERWDGTYKGQPAEISTYFYQLKLRNVKGEDFLFKGDFVLIR